MMTECGVSIIICAYTERRWDDLIAAVRSVQRQTAVAREVIVVVDHNPPLLERVRGHFPEIVALPNNEARGLSGARNTGIDAAHGALIAFLDDDAIAEPDWLERLCASFADPSILGSGGAVIPLWERGRPAWFPAEFDWVVGCTYRGLPARITPVRNPFGGCLCIRREVFETIGGFRSDIGRVEKRPLGCEETELCIRARQRWPGAFFVYEPRARIHHRVPAERARVSYFRARCYAEGRSKALVVRYVGTRDGLASERTYTLRTLPRGVAHGLGESVRRGDPMGAVRAAMIVMGLAVTVTGYATGRMSEWWGQIRNGRADVAIAQERLAR